MNRCLLIFVFLMLSVVAFGQNRDVERKQRMPYYGYVVAGDSLLPVRNSHVISKMGHCGTITNRQGEFVISAKTVDTLWVSCLGFSRQLLPIDSTMVNDTLLVVLEVDTITLREVTILPFNDYETFKEMFITMPSIETPRELQMLEKDLDELWLSRPPAGNGMLTVSASPIQFLYDKYNKSARRQSRLLYNRRMYNEVLREQGRNDELLPDSLDYAIDYRVYQLDEPLQTGNPKAMVPRKKYIWLGNKTR